MLVLVYLATKEQFLIDGPTIEDKVQQAVKEKLGRNTKSESSEFKSWTNSLGNAMSYVMRSPGIPNNAIVAIEYKLKLGKERIDFIVAGISPSGRESMLIIELKQWSEIQFADIEDHVTTFIGKALMQKVHPSYQANSYKSQFLDKYEYVYSTNMEVSACAYLHNLRTGDVINDSRYAHLISETPVFIHGQVSDLQNLIESKIKKGTGLDLMQRVDSSEVRPSKQLADALNPMLLGIEEFVLIESQKTIFERVMLAAKSGSKSKKKVLIIEGGPGTGKSVIAVNALAKISGLRLNCLYVTPNSAPRDVFKWKLRGVMKNHQVDDLLKGSAVFTEIKKNTYDVLLVDEAHRLKLRSQYQKGKNQIAEIINSTSVSVFFIDELQKVTWQDIGEVSTIKSFAEECGAEIQHLELETQFRCNGSNSYIDWLDNALGVRVEPDSFFEPGGFDFKIVDSPKELHEMIKEKNKINNKSRLLAGYCWDWVSKKDRNKTDIKILEFNFEANWNLSKHGGTYIVQQDSVEQIGCIHTSQGLELEYVGVIIGPDLVTSDGQLTTDPLARAKTDQSLKGFKKEFKTNPVSASKKADEIIRNTYRILMTRGMKGCYVYFTDQKTADYFKKLLQA